MAVIGDGSGGCSGPSAAAQYVRSLAPARRVQLFSDDGGCGGGGERGCGGGGSGFGGDSRGGDELATQSTSSALPKIISNYLPNYLS